VNSKNTEKLVILSEIDELKVIANNHYLMGKFNEAIKVTEKIIEITEKAKLYSIAREQGDFIAEIYKKIKDLNKDSLIREEFELLRGKYVSLLEKDRVIEAHQLVSRFKEKLSKLYEIDSIEVIKEFFDEDEKTWSEYSKSEYNIKKQLEPLDIQFKSYLSTNNILLASETLEKAKILLVKLEDSNILKKWEVNDSKFIKLKNSVELKQSVDDSLKNVSELTDNYEFNDAKKILDSTLALVNRDRSSEHMQRIETKMKSVIDAEAKYAQLEKDLRELEELVKLNVSKNLFQNAINNLNQMIKISRFIGETQFLDKYTKYVEEIENKINNIKRNETTKNTIKTLNIQGIEAIKREEFSNAIQRFEDIVNLLNKII